MSTDYLTLIRHSFRYSPKTGRLHWKAHLHGGRKVNLLRCPSGVYRVQVGHERFQAHDVTWFVVHGTWPTAPLRHLNGNRWDNSIANLALTARPCYR